MPRAADIPPFETMTREQYAALIEGFMAGQRRLSAKIAGLSSNLSYYKKLEAKRSAPTEPRRVDALEIEVASLAAENATLRRVLAEEKEARAMAASELRLVTDLLMRARGREVAA